MDNILLLQGFNNYYNRIIKYKFNSIYDYPEGEFFGGINFVPKDGINTELIIGGQTRPIIGNDYDYLVVFDENTQEIKSRWFILEALFITKGQYRLQLRRDLITDYFDSVKNSTAFISRGLVSATNPLIFNREDMSFNQIKKSEHLLKDSTQCGWIVGYVAPDLGTITDEQGDVTEQDFDVNLEYAAETIPDISTFEFNELVGQTFSGLLDVENSWYKLGYAGVGLLYVLKTFLNGTTEIPLFPEHYVIWPNIARILDISFGTTQPVNVDIQAFQDTINNYLDNQDIEQILSYKDKVFNDNGVLKRVKITRLEGFSRKSFNANLAEYPSLYNAIYNAYSQLTDTFVPTPGDQFNLADWYIPVDLAYNQFRLELEEVGTPITSGTITFKRSNKRLHDGPYKMFCMPVSDSIKLAAGTDEFFINRDKQLQIATSIATGLGANLYDIQLLPYCPIKDEFTLENNTLTYIGGTSDIDFTIATDAADQAQGIIFWVDRASFTLNIFDLGTLPEVETSEPIEFKIGNETNYIRMVSPNYANFEDINIYMNYGVDFINVDCTYKPLTPYIKLNINYKGLYGADYNDNRGLILGGDFSLPIMSDAWINYTIQNKNYANIFDRETQHLEFRHQWDLAQTSFGAVSGTVAGGAMGGMVGGGAGALVGGTLSAVGGALDIGRNVTEHIYSMDFRRDTYKMNLQNIQALPQGLVKTSAFNYNSKIYPFLEVYSSTEEEKTLLRTKLHYTSMTINAIGKIEEYLSIDRRNMGYLQAQLIRIDLAGESHLATAINEELSKGVYI